MTAAFHSRESCIPYVTKDGSIIREISKAINQSLAEATVLPGKSTIPHYHIQAEEIYYILTGESSMFVGEELRGVSPGDAIVIPSGEQHHIRNTGEEDLVFLCCCAPGYRHEDTVFVED